MLVRFFVKGIKLPQYHHLLYYFYGRWRRRHLKKKSQICWPNKSAFMCIWFISQPVLYLMISSDNFWADWYIHWTHKGTTMLGGERNFSISLFMCSLLMWPCLFIVFFVKHFRNYLSLHYEILLYRYGYLCYYSKFNKYKKEAIGKKSYILQRQKREAKFSCVIWA